MRPFEWLKWPYPEIHEPQPTGGCLLFLFVFQTKSIIPVADGDIFSGNYENFFEYCLELLADCVVFVSFQMFALSFFRFSLSFHVCNFPLTVSQQCVRMRADVFLYEFSSFHRPTEEENTI